MLERSTLRLASRASSVHLREPKRTMTGRFSCANELVFDFVRAAASCRPPTFTPSILTPFAITSRREWS